MRAHTQTHTHKYTHSHGLLTVKKETCRYWYGVGAALGFSSSLFCPMTLTHQIILPVIYSKFDFSSISTLKFNVSLFSPELYPRQQSGSVCGRVSHHPSPEYPSTETKCFTMQFFQVGWCRDSRRNCFRGRTFFLCLVSDVTPLSHLVATPEWKLTSCTYFMYFMPLPL